MSSRQVREEAAGLEVGPPPSQGTKYLNARPPLSSYGPPSNMQDGALQDLYPERGKHAAAGDRLATSSRNPLGLSPFIYGLLVALITLVIVGAALGGGLGASLASAQSRNYYYSALTSSTSSTKTSSSTASSTPTTYSTPTTSSTPTTCTAAVFNNYVPLRPTSSSDTLALDCPALDQQTYTTTHGDTFLMSCNVSLAYYDIVGIAAYTSDDCIEACSSMNASDGTNLCNAVTFYSEMYWGWEYNTNCWFKFQDSIGSSSSPGWLSAKLQ